MMMQGQVVVSREQKSGKNVVGASTESEASGSLVETSFSGQRRGVSVGRTVNLGDFNFARIEVAFEFSTASMPEGENAIDCAHRIANEILFRECAAILERERESVSMTEADALLGRRVRLTYGITKSLKAFESVKFDVSADQPLADGEAFEAALSKIQAETGDFIKRELSRASKAGSDIGF
jgi:hypothetical protein